MRQAQIEANKYRYERKFFVAELNEHEIIALVKLHPAIFSEIFYPRYINNLYLDSSSMSSYFDNVDGLQNRMKIRIRWYGDLLGLIEKPVLEFKIKDGLVGRKESFSLAPFSIDRRLQLDCIRRIIGESKIPADLKLQLINLEISLLNRYRRRYFQSVDRKFRLTLDTEMEYFQVGAFNNTFLHKSVDLNNSVVELKYDSAADESARWVTDYFPFRMTKNSKYVNGIDRTCL